jgi:hypothetical protein
MTKEIALEEAGALKQYAAKIHDVKHYSVVHGVEGNF